MDLGADCALYMPSFLDVDELCRLLASGINVVTTCGHFDHPASVDPDVRTKVQTACELGEEPRQPVAQHLILSPVTLALLLDDVRKPLGEGEQYSEHVFGNRR